MTSAAWKVSLGRSPLTPKARWLTCRLLDVHGRADPLSTESTRAREHDPLSGLACRALPHLHEVAVAWRFGESSRNHLSQHFFMASLRRLEKYNRGSHFGPSEVPILRA